MKLGNIIVISLERATERRKRITSQLDKLGINATIMNAIDGKSLPEHEIKRKIDNDGRWRDGELFRSGEIGCLKSHIKALEIAKENQWDQVIILEDDVILSSDFIKGLKFMYKILPSNWDHVFLGGHIYWANPPALQPTVIPVNFKVSGAYSYIVKNTSYDKILAMLNQMKTPVDDVIEKMTYFEKVLNSYIFFPFLAYPIIEDSYIWDIKNKTDIHPSIKYFKDKL